MKTQEWNFYKKSEWPERGPWDNEPDKIQWTDEKTGLPCLIVRNPMGALCGYVGVAEGHPAFEKSYNDVDVSVHGGLTFSDSCQPEPKVADHPTICHVPEPGEPDKVWWLGFDCLHAGDRYPATSQVMLEINQRFARNHRGDSYKNVDYVRENCRMLAEQLKDIEELEPRTVPNSTAGFLD